MTGCPQKTVYFNFKSYKNNKYALKTFVRRTWLKHVTPPLLTVGSEMPVHINDGTLTYGHMAIEGYHYIKFARWT